jgi:hypothetical protein
VGQSTASAKARIISQTLDTSCLDPEWSLPSLLDQNLLVWMAQVNGVLVNLRDMPREVQEIAFEKGMTPTSQTTGREVPSSTTNPPDLLKHTLRHEVTDEAATVFTKLVAPITLDVIAIPQSTGGN